MFIVTQDTIAVDTKYIQILETCKFMDIINVDFIFEYHLPIKISNGFCVPSLCMVTFVTWLRFSQITLRDI